MHTMMRDERGGSGCLCLLFASQGCLVFFQPGPDDLYEYPMLAGIHECIYILQNDWHFTLREVLERKNEKPTVGWAIPFWGFGFPVRPCCTLPQTLEIQHMNASVWVYFAPCYFKRCNDAENPGYICRIVSLASPLASCAMPVYLSVCVCERGTE
jgi:hypothetical protein